MNSGRYNPNTDSVFQQKGSHIPSKIWLKSSRRKKNKQFFHSWKLYQNMCWIGMKTKFADVAACSMLIVHMPSYSRTTRRSCGLFVVRKRQAYVQSTAVHANHALLSFSRPKAMAALLGVGLVAACMIGNDTAYSYEHAFSVKVPARHSDVQTSW